MKTKPAMLSVLSLGLAILLANCSGNKKEASENADGNNQVEQTETAPRAVKVNVFDNVDAGIKTQLNGFLSDYFALNETLIEDNLDGAKASAKKLTETVGKFDMTKLMGEQMDFYHNQQAKLNQALKGIAESADIEEARTELATISEAMYALAKAYHPNESEIYYQFCPMAKNGDGASWLSATKEIVNPYMGQRMLTCGRTEETL